MDRHYYTGTASADSAQSTEWVVLKAQPHREFLAAQAVSGRGVPSFLPMLPARRAGQHQRPLFPGYVFAAPKPGTDDLLRIRSAPGIAHVLPRGGPPTRLPGELIEALRERALTPAPLHKGERLKVIRGPFRWVEAVFDRRLNSAGRVRVLLELVHQFVPAELDEQDLERAG